MERPISATYSLSINVLTLYVPAQMLILVTLGITCELAQILVFLISFFNRSSPSVVRFHRKHSPGEIALPRVAIRRRGIQRVFHVVECMYTYVNNFALCRYIKDCALGKCVSFVRLIMGKRQERTPDIQAYGIEGGLVIFGLLFTTAFLVKRNDVRQVYRLSCIFTCTRNNVRRQVEKKRHYFIT